MPRSVLYDYRDTYFCERDNRSVVGFLHMGYLKIT